LPPGNSGASPPDAGLTLVADTHYGFSATQGWCSWTYGYEAPPSTVFQPMTEWDPGYPAWWVKNGTYWTLVAPDVQHPNGTGTTGGRSPVEQWSVRRWTSTLAGDVVISGSARMAIAGGNGIDARIVVDGVVKYSRVVPGDDTVGIPFAVTASVVSGSTVDFIVDPHLSQDAVDTTYFAAQIWK
jgi:hypothetical protein